MLFVCVFVFYCYAAHRDLHSFPTRRSSDLVTLHVFYGHQSTDRVGELSAIAKWLAGWADEVDNWGHNLICLGDFNRSEEHTSELQSLTNLVCRLLLEKKKQTHLKKPDKKYT